MAQFTATVRIEIAEANGNVSVHERTVTSPGGDNPRFYASISDDVIDQARRAVVAPMRNPAEVTR